MNSESKPITFLAIYVAFTLITIALTPIPHGQHFFVGFSLGSLFAFTMLTTIWIVFGPGSRKLRWPLSFVLLISILLAFATKDNNIIGPVFIAQIAIVATTFAVCGYARLQFGARILVNKTPEDDQAQKALRQYGVRHLLVMMAVTAVLLSLARLMVPRLTRSGMTDFSIFAMLAFMACVLCFPIILSQLCLNRTVWPTLFILGATVLITWNEAKLLTSLRLRGPEFHHFVWINFFSILPVLFITAGLRWCGYRLVTVRSLRS